MVIEINGTEFVLKEIGIIGIIISLFTLHFSLLYLLPYPPLLRVEVVGP